MQTGPQVPRRGQPIIGVCGVPAVTAWGYWTQPAVLVAETYLSAIRRAGGLPVVLPPSSPESGPVTEVLAALDGVVLAGGSDVSPQTYAAAAGPRMEESVLERDLFEVAIATAAIERDLPVLGVCRGLQILNVATGGTLHQHLPDAGFDEHRRAPRRLDGVTNHPVEVEHDSLLGACGLGDLREVNSHHHQGVARVGVGGRVIARSVPDSVAEAVQWSAHTFVLGVQWHPEDPPMDGLFRGLVAASRPAPSEHLSPAPA
jgi:putative glutamine amidotransferase